MGDFFGESELLNRGCAIAAADDAGGGTVGDGFGNGPCSEVERWHFENAHWAIPNHGARFADFRCVKLRGFRTNVEAFKVVRNLASLHDDLVAVAVERVATVSIHGQNQLASAGCHQFLREFHSVKFYSALANLAAFG